MPAAEDRRAVAVSDVLSRSTATNHLVTYLGTDGVACLARLSAANIAAISRHDQNVLNGGFPQAAIGKVSMSALVAASRRARGG